MKPLFGSWLCAAMEILALAAQLFLSLFMWLNSLLLFLGGKCWLE